MKERIEELLLQESKTHDPSLQTRIGELYLNGEGVEKDLHKALSFFENASDAGDEKGTVYLMHLYSAPKNIVPFEDDEAEFARHLEDAKKERPSAQYYIGMCYLLGICVEQNNKEAISLFTKAAEKGAVFAQYRLGKLYAGCDGIEQNSALSFKWFLKAAEQGHLSAQRFVSRCYRKGVGVHQDLTAAFTWMNRAATDGFVDAQYELGNYFYEGIGVKQDLFTAVRLFIMAAEKKHPEALHALDQIGSSFGLPLELAFPVEEKEFENVVVSIEKRGEYHYYMTNSIGLLRKKLSECNCRIPVPLDFKMNPYLAKEVMDKMSSLDMYFSLETDCANVLNFYIPGTLPFIYKLDKGNGLSESH